MSDEFPFNYALSVVITNDETMPPDNIITKFLGDTIWYFKVTGSILYNADGMRKEYSITEKFAVRDIILKTEGKEFVLEKIKERVIMRLKMEALE